MCTTCGNAIKLYILPTRCIMFHIILIVNSSYFLLWTAGILEIFLLERDLNFSIPQMLLVFGKLKTSTVYLNSKALRCDWLIHEMAVPSPEIVILLQL